MRSSKLTRVGDEVLMKRSRAFLWILIGLVAVRFGLRAYIEQTVSAPQTGALFFLLALGAIVRWRAGMLVEYLKLRAPPQGAPG
jgi:membrane protein CcdC involved in cytochrome C biogenesis